MKKIIYAFKPFLSEITHDFMLIACIMGPIIVGCAFRFLVPMLEKLLCAHFALTQIITPYYIIFDMLLAILTQIMFCFAGVLVILEESDCGVTKYYAVTPLGKSGYLFARIGIPIILAFIYSIALLCIFSITDVSISMMFILSIGGGLLAMITSLIVISFAKNKMEGMALVKLCGMIIFGIPVAYFVSSPIRYLFGVLPSFWLAELCITNNYLFMIPTLLSSFIIILALYVRFKKKLL